MQAGRVRGNEMARPDFVTCRRCGRHRDERHPDGQRVGPISWGGNCIRCGKAAQNEELDQMAAKQGHHFDAWRIAMIRCAGGVVPDNLLARERSS